MTYYQTKMKQLKDIKIGDKVWVYGDGGKVDEFYVIYLNRRDNGSAELGYYRTPDYPKNCRPYEISIKASADYPTTTSTSFGLYAATVYFNQESVIERFDKDIRNLEIRKEQFIKTIIIN